MYMELNQWYICGKGMYNVMNGTYFDALNEDMNNYRDIRVIDDQVTRALLTKIALFFERIKYYDLSENVLSRMHDDINIALEDLKKEKMNLHNHKDTHVTRFRIRLVLKIFFRTIGMFVSLGVIGSAVAVSVANAMLTLLSLPLIYAGGLGSIYSLMTGTDAINNLYLSFENYEFLIDKYINILEKEKIAVERLLNRIHKKQQNR